MAETTSKDTLDVLMGKTSKLLNCALKLHSHPMGQKNGRIDKTHVIVDRQGYWEMQRAAYELLLWADARGKGREDSHE